MQGQPGWELKNEKNKNHIRWLLVLLVAVYLAFLLWSGRAEEIGPAHLLSYLTIGILFVIGVAFCFFSTLYLGRHQRTNRPLHPSFKYISMCFDLSIITVVLVPTGGSASMLFFLYFIVVVSNALRYGMRLALAGVFAFNLLYVAMLVYQHYPTEEVQGLAREILKVGGVWLVGIYAGYLARRFEYLREEVEKYKELVRVLMDRADAKERSEGHG